MHEPSVEITDSLSIGSLPVATGWAAHLLYSDNETTTSIPLTTAQALRLAQALIDVATEDR